MKEGTSLIPYRNRKDCNKRLEPIKLDSIDDLGNFIKRNEHQNGLKKD